MNFSTDLPKSSPMVNYIVASAIRSSRSTPGKLRDLPCFRMHAVVLKDTGNFLAVTSSKADSAERRQRTDTVPHQAGGRHLRRLPQSEASLHRRDREQRESGQQPNCSGQVLEHSPPQPRQASSRILLRQSCRYFKGPRYTSAEERYSDGKG